MKPIVAVLALGMIGIFNSCSTERNSTVITTESSEPALADYEVEYYETDFEVRQKDYINLLTGTWTINSMQRQARLPIENLSGMTLVLNTDRSFNIKADCGNITGNYTVKGTSIKFSNVSSNTNSCTNTEQVSELVRLLSNTVSAYTVDNSSLWLRDGSTNIIFKAGK